MNSQEFLEKRTEFFNSYQTLGTNIRDFHKLLKDVIAIERNKYDKLEEAKKSEYYQALKEDKTVISNLFIRLDELAKSILQNPNVTLDELNNALKVVGFISNEFEEEFNDIKKSIELNAFSYAADFDELRNKMSSRRNNQSSRYQKYLEEVQQQLAFGFTQQPQATAGNNQSYLNGQPIPVYSTSSPSPTLLQNAKKFVSGTAGKLTVLAAGAALVITTLYGCGIGKSKDNSQTAGADTSTETMTETETTEELNVETETETNVETETDNKKAENTINTSANLGEPGTFTEFTEEQIHARAQYLYDNIYTKFDGTMNEGLLNQMYPEHRNHISVEGIENVIRTLNGIPPVNENGEYYVSVNMGDTILNEAAFYLFGVPSALYDQNCRKIYQNVPSHLFTLDNTELSRFLAGYDEAYEEFSKAYNRGDGNATYKASQKIAEKMYYEWHMDGVFGDQNPYLLNAEQLKFARMCSVDKWVNYVYEYEQDIQAAICVDVCTDYVTKEMSTLEGDKIQTAIVYDLWTNTVAISAGMLDEVEKSKQEHGIQYEAQVFMRYLLNEINYQYETNYKGKTVSDAKAYTLK